MSWPSKILVAVLFWWILHAVQHSTTTIRRWVFYYLLLASACERLEYYADMKEWWAKWWFCVVEPWLVCFCFVFIFNKDYCLSPFLFRLSVATDIVLLSISCRICLEITIPCCIYSEINSYKLHVSKCYCWCWRHWEQNLRFCKFWISRWCLQIGIKLNTFIYQND